MHFSLLCLTRNNNYFSTNVEREGVIVHVWRGTKKPTLQHLLAFLENRVFYFAFDFWCCKVGFFVSRHIYEVKINESIRKTEAHFELN